MRKPHVLVVDDHELYRKAVERILVRAGHQVSTARDAGEAMQRVTSEPLDLVLCDVKMPGISGLELVRQIRELQPDLPCIVITGYGGAEASLEALRAGAYWYLEKPVEPAHHDVLRRLAAQAIEHGRLKTENRLLQRQLQGRYRFENLIGSSAALRRVLDLVERVADTDSTVLVTGESGTGKEMVARALHWSSRRAERMFVTVNCGAIPEELLESELFGHVRGAFTNAVSHREGRFSLAHGGTIFLDEIGDMSPTLQVKLLRVLQDRTFEPVGSSHSDQGGRARDRGHPPEARAGDPREALPRGSLLPAQRDPDRGARRCASGARTFRCWWRTSCAWPARRRSSAPARSRPRRSSGWCGTTGRATCASSRT